MTSDYTSLNIVGDGHHLVSIKKKKKSVSKTVETMKDMHVLFGINKPIELHSQIHALPAELTGRTSEASSSSQNYPGGVDPRLQGHRIREGL